MNDSIKREWPTKTNADFDEMMKAMQKSKNDTCTVCSLIQSLQLTMRFADELTEEPRTVTLATLYLLGIQSRVSWNAATFLLRNADCSTTEEWNQLSPGQQDFVIKVTNTALMFLRHRAKNQVKQPHPVVNDGIYYCNYILATLYTCQYTYDSQYSNILHPSNTGTKTQKSIEIKKSVPHGCYHNGG